MNKGIDFNIKKQYNKLTKSEKRVADFILENMGDIYRLSIVEVSELAGVSQPTIIRFVRAIGYEGYKEFKLAVAEEMGAKNKTSPLYGFDINKNNRLDEIPSNIIGTAIDKLEKTLKNISVDNYIQAVNAITKADKIVIFYVENSAVTAYDLMTKLVYLGINCNIYDDYYLQSVAANCMTEKDLAIAISYSGCSRNTVDVIKAARNKSAQTLVITNFEHSVIAKYGTIVLTCDNEQFLYGDAIFSRVTQLAVVDMLYMGVILSDYDRYTKILENNSRLVKSRAYVQN